MRFEVRTKIRIALVVLCVQIGLIQSPRAFSQEPSPQSGRKAAPSPRGGFKPMPVDPRVQMRSYLFKDGDVSQNLEYAVFVSSKVTRDKKAPLIITLHGLGAGPAIMFGAKALELAEEGGYILVGPMGYNVRGWYGISMKGFGPKPKPAAKEPAQTDAAAKPKPSMFSDPNDPPNLNELSEKDVMTVLDMVRKEFNVDDRRIYLMGHSMGGAGTLYLGVKYSSIWAALAPIAPAAFTLNPDSLKAIPTMPILFVHGDADEVVPVANTRPWIEKLKELNMTYEYNEMPGVSHGPVIEQALPSVYAFFAKHSKPTVQ
ncbi:MAG: prolyl oligopeptidase family serine peptidase [Acidobacteriota bacterium]|nr:prolyl oligopeptidase family serine peptidase [Acidobacteriota bacterium]